MLSQIMGILSNGLRFAGIVMAIYGVVQLGFSQSDPGGNQISGAIRWIVGGLIVIAASVLFSQVDTSWANAAGIRIPIRW